MTATAASSILPPGAITSPLPGSSRCSIYARFKYHLKMSIRQYLEHQRLRAVMELLGRDELDMAPIAQPFQGVCVEGMCEVTFYLPFLG